MTEFSDMEHPIHSMTPNEPLEMLEVARRGESGNFHPVVKKDICPYCSSDNTLPRGASSTLLGYALINRNHQWRHFNCRDCQKESVHNIHGLNHWYSDKKHGSVLKGISSCCDTQHPCHCGGDLEVNLADPSSRRTLNSTWRIKCTNCHASCPTLTKTWSGHVEDEWDHLGLTKPEPGTFKIVRRLSTSTVNTEAITRFVLKVDK